MSAVLESIRSKARNALRARKRRIVLGDATDARMLEAAREAKREGIAEPILLGEREVILRKPENASFRDVTIISPREFSQIEHLAEDYFARRAGKVPSLRTAMEELRANEMLFGAAMVQSGYADGMVAGSLSTTADVIRAAIKGIGLADGVSTISSMFLIALPAVPGFRELERTIAFADCGVVVEPTPEQLADIAIETAKTFHLLTGIEPRVAMLSFSTHGSAQSDSTEKMITATNRVREKAPTLLIDGELQFDSAFVPDVAARKAPTSDVAGHANVFIFPNLDAGNISYKIAERLGFAQAIGPILQGLRKPMNDLSRGARVSDIVNMIAITAIQNLDSAD